MLFRRALLGLWLLTRITGAQTPLPQAHSHNDYEHARPLLDALDQGFCSVEADIFLIDGQLLVAHERSQVKPERSLQALYLDPLRDRARKFQGRIFPGGPPFTLLIDIKTEATPTYARLREVLLGYRDVLTSFSDSGIRTNAITVVLSGNRPFTEVGGEKERWVGLDGRVPDLDRAWPAALVPLVSDNWTQHFQWRGTGEFPAEEKAQLEKMVGKAHAQGRRIRFWAAPDVPAMWQVQAAAGVDVINTDRLADLAAFLKSVAPAH